MMHDFAITDRHAVWLDLPVVFDSAALRAGHALRLGRRATARGSASCRATRPGRGAAGSTSTRATSSTSATRRRTPTAGSCSTPPATRQPPSPGCGHASATPGTRPGTRPRSAAATLHRWTLDPASGSVKEEARDDRGVEFPTFNDALLGRPSRYLYTVGQNSNAIVKYDHQTGAAQVRDDRRRHGRGGVRGRRGRRGPRTRAGCCRWSPRAATPSCWYSTPPTCRTWRRSGCPSVCRPVSTGLGWRTPRASKRWLTLRVAGVRQAQSDQPPTLRIARHEPYFVQPRAPRILSG